MADRFRVTADKDKGLISPTEAMGPIQSSPKGDTSILHSSLFILHYEEIAFRMLPSAFFSSLDTWAWEMPISLATSICVRPSWKRRAKI